MSGFYTIIVNTTGHVLGIIFNFMLILVVGLATYIISARKNREKINTFMSSGDEDDY